MNTQDLLLDAFGRIREAAGRAIDGLDADALAWRPDPAANSVGWLVWHLVRVIDHHVSDLAEEEQAWIVDAWADRFGMPAEAQDIGYGHTSEQVAAVRPLGPEILNEYLDAVLERTARYVGRVAPEEWEEIVDERWDPPVSAGVRIVSVIDDSLQHAGQANYVRGMYERSGSS